MVIGISVLMCWVPIMGCNLTTAHMFFPQGECSPKDTCFSCHMFSLHLAMPNDSQCISPTLHCKENPAISHGHPKSDNFPIHSPFTPGCGWQQRLPSFGFLGEMISLPGRWDDHDDHPSSKRILRKNAARYKKGWMVFNSKIVILKLGGN